MKDKHFNTIRFMSEIAITAGGSFYFALSEIWGLPYGEAVMATCAAVSTFLGIFTEWQRYKYNKAKESAYNSAMDEIKED